MMKLEDQVVSLELAKKLKELGVKQESLFYWQACPENLICLRPAYIELGYKDTPERVVISAFTVAELGEILPPYFCSVDAKASAGHWTCRKWSHGIIDTEVPIQYANTEADARAKALIYLIENKLINLDN